MAVSKKTHRVMLVPAGFGVGLTSVALGLVHACQQQGIKVAHFKPISQLARNKRNAAASDSYFTNNNFSVSLSYVEQKMGDGDHEVVLEEIVANCERIEQDSEIVIIEGLIPTTRQPYAARINRDVAQALSADIVMVAAPDNDDLEQFEDRLEVTSQTYGGIKNKRLLGCIINKINSPDKDEYGLLPRENEIAPADNLHQWQNLSIFNHTNFELLGTIPWELDLIAPRVKDIADYLDATILNEGDMYHRRIRSVTFCARTVGNLVSHLVSRSFNRYTW